MFCAKSKSEDKREYETDNSHGMFLNSCDELNEVHIEINTPFDQAKAKPYPIACFQYVKFSNLFLKSFLTNQKTNDSAFT